MTIGLDIDNTLVNTKEAMYKFLSMKMTEKKNY